MAHHDDELPSIDAADLKSVTGGTGMDMSMLPIVMMLKNKQQAAPQQVAAPPTPAAPAKPNILVNGQPAQLDASGNISVDPSDV